MDRSESMEDIKVMTPNEVAALLKVSPGWVYAHKHALGAFQLSPRAPVRFLENRIVEILNALPDEEWKMACKAHDRRRGQNPRLFDKSGGKKVGGGAGGGSLEERDRHNLLA